MAEERELRSFTQAMVMLDEYIAAYEMLHVEHMRLERRLRKVLELLEHARAAIDNDLWLANSEVL